jgi:1,2-phenylacetyl-CoA epoxidase catalytic subunit
MDDESTFERYIASGGRLSSPDNASSRYRGELMRLMAVFVDSEMAGAAGFADSINLAPGIKERMIAARIVLEKFGHAQRVLAIMEQFGANTSRYVGHHPWANREHRNVDLGTRRVAGDMRLNIFHYPISDWCDAVTMNMLMGSATVVQLEELAACSYQPLADAIEEIVPVERRHAALGEGGLRQLLADGYDRVAAQSSVNYWYPRVAATFGRAASDHFDAYRRYGLRQRSNEELLAGWQAHAARILARLGLDAPGAP